MSIKFICTETGKLDLSEGMTCFSDLLPIGAIALNGGKGFANQCICYWLSLLGKIQVYMERGELSEPDHQRFGWLIASLGELGSYIQQEQDEMLYQIEKLNEAEKAAE